MGSRARFWWSFVDLFVVSAAKALWRIFKPGFVRAKEEE